MLLKAFVHSTRVFKFRCWLNIVFYALNFHLLVSAPSLEDCEMLKALVCVFVECICSLVL